MISKGKMENPVMVIERRKLKEQINNCLFNAII